MPGDLLRWADPLCEGPLRPHPDDLTRQRERAAYLAARFRLPVTESYRELMGADWRVDQCERYDEVVLWFEADLYDQLILVYLLARLARTAPAAKLRLVTLHRYPGVRRFVGLGQLQARQLRALLARRKRVTARQQALAVRAWAAFQAPSPSRLARLARLRSSAMPYLGAAIRRYLAEYPSLRNGLSRTEQLIMETLVRGPATPRELFERVQAREPRPFLGDLMFFAAVRDLAVGPRPLIHGRHRRFLELRLPELGKATVEATPLGRRVLAGRADWRRICGVAKWMGGVYLPPGRPPWRWDADRERIVAMDSR